MPNKHKYRLTLPLVLISAIFAGCSKDKPSAPPDKAPSAEKAEAGGDKVVTLSADEGATSGVHTAVLEQQIFADQLTVTATIEPAQGPLREHRAAHIRKSGQGDGRPWRASPRGANARFGR